MHRVESSKDFIDILESSYSELGTRALVEQYVGGPFVYTRKPNADFYLTDVYGKVVYVQQGSDGLSVVFFSSDKGPHRIVFKDEYTFKAELCHGFLYKLGITKKSA